MKKKEKKCISYTGKCGMSRMKGCRKKLGKKLLSGTHYLSGLQRWQPRRPASFVSVLHELVYYVWGTAGLTQRSSDHSLWKCTRWLFLCLSRSSRTRDTLFSLCYYIISLYYHYYYLPSLLLTHWRQVLLSQDDS